MAVDPKTTAYTVLSALKHDGKMFKKGSIVRLTDKEAASLLKYKSIEPAK
jgi:hypothetical protein